MKQQDILKLSDADLRNQVSTLEDKIARLKLSHKVTPVENPLQIRSVRKTIARLKTELTKRATQA
jgi:large subunit ribosomal protein L29